MDQQLTFFRTEQRISLGSVVNVASVPKRSPFRYPGGKTWLVPRIRQWLASRPRPRRFVEPFAGGAIVSLTVGAEDLADSVVMVELDEQVAAVWSILLSGNAAGLAERIVNFKLDVTSLQAALACEPSSVDERAFQTILKNRTFHGGILAAGSAPIKNGENGKGITSRWYPETLNQRIQDIINIRHKFSFVQGDGVEYIRGYSRESGAVFFVDPPYTAAGKKAGRRLYSHYDLDHEELFRVTSTLQGDFLMTYDNAEGVKELADQFGFDVEAVAMKNTHHAEMTELLIGRDLEWLRRGQSAGRRAG